MKKTFIVNGKEIHAENYKLEHDTLSFTLEGKNYFFSMIKRQGHELIIDDHVGRLKAAVSTPTKDGEVMIIAAGSEAKAQEGGKKSKKSGSQVGGLTSPMPGKIFKILKEVGTQVEKGESILILEAMKMEHAIRSDKAGVVKKIQYKPGELVQGGVVLAEVE